MIPVLLGVLTALFISSLKQNYDNQKFLDKIYSSIEKEMQSNTDEFTTTLPKQYRLVDSVQFYISDEDISIVEIIKKSNGLQIPSTRNTTWKSFLNSKLELVDFEVVSILTDVEEKKHFMNIKLEKLVDFIYENTNATNQQDKELFILHLHEIIETEEGLVETYNDYLKLSEQLDL